MADEATIKAAVDAVRAIYNVQISQLKANSESLHKELRALTQTVIDMKRDLLGRQRQQGSRRARS